MSTDFPYQEYVQNRITMTPEKFGMLGSYARSTLQAVASEDLAYMLDQQLVRFTMNVMSGKTVSEHPEVTFTYNIYASWWQHLKHALSNWRDAMNVRWETEPTPWMILLWPFLVLHPKWARRHPVNQTSMLAKTTVDFKQSVLYPEMDYIPPEFGYPVIFETMDMPGTGTGFGLNTGIGRFMNRHEVMSEYMRDPASAPDGYPGSVGSSAYPVAFLSWLERNGVNPDQLVKRR